jgi:hypothetical protein
LEVQPGSDVAEGPVAVSEYPTITDTLNVGVLLPEATEPNGRTSLAWWRPTGVTKNTIDGVSIVNTIPVLLASHR